MVDDSVGGGGGRVGEVSMVSETREVGSVSDVLVGWAGEQVILIHN